MKLYKYIKPVYVNLNHETRTIFGIYHTKMLASKHTYGSDRIITVELTKNDVKQILELNGYKVILEE